MASQVNSVKALEIESESPNEKDDLLVVEEPLEIRLDYGPPEMRIQKNLAVTMRTPGHDLELAAGFLFTENLISGMEDIHAIHHCRDTGKMDEIENVVKIKLNGSKNFDLDRLERNFYTTSSCGVCGKSSIEAVKVINDSSLHDLFPRVSREMILALPDKLLEVQTAFEHTGGLHATGLFNNEGRLILVREDVGRHNAMDKVIGAALGSELTPLHNYIILVSGRASFELVQKAAMGGGPVLAAIGAPSTLAVKTAEEFGMTLIGFLRNGRFNIYSGKWRFED